MEVHGNGNLEIDPSAFAIDELEADLHQNIDTASYGLTAEELELLHSNIHKLAALIIKNQHT